MGNIQKLPFLSGCTAAILAGMISYAAGAENQTIYIRMAVMMFLFYIIGVLVKNTVLNTKIEIEGKKELEQEEARKKRKQKDEIAGDETVPSQTADLRDEGTAAESKGERDGAGPDLEEEFRALSDVILTRAKE